MTIHLHHLKFHAGHGVFHQETQTGNQFELNVDVSFNAPAVITSLSETINYAFLYEVIKKRMEQPTRLLETIVQQLADLLKQADPRITAVHISLKKLSPPITGFEGSVGVSYQKSFNA